MTEYIRPFRGEGDSRQRTNWGVVGRARRRAAGEPMREDRAKRTPNNSAKRIPSSRLENLVARPSRFGFARERSSARSPGSVPGLLQPEGARARASLVGALAGARRRTRAAP